jgi:hypothetical protein
MWRAVAVCMVLGLGACAGTGGQREFAPSKGVDLEKVATVNRWAEDHGAVVIWVNMPSKSRPVD